MDDKEKVYCEICKIDTGKDYPMHEEDNGWGKAYLVCGKNNKHKKLLREYPVDLSGLSGHGTKKL